MINLDSFLLWLTTMWLDLSTPWQVSLAPDPFSETVNDEWDVRLADDPFADDEWIVEDAPDPFE